MRTRASERKMRYRSSNDNEHAISSSAPHLELKMRSLFQQQVDEITQRIEKTTDAEIERRNRKTRQNHNESVKFSVRGFTKIQ